MLACLRPVSAARGLARRAHWRPWPWECSSKSSRVRAAQRTSHARPRVRREVPRSTMLVVLSRMPVVPRGPARQQRRCWRTKREPSVPSHCGATFKLGASLRFVSSSVFTQTSKEASSSAEGAISVSSALPARFAAAAARSCAPYQSRRSPHCSHTSSGGAARSDCAHSERHVAQIRPQITPQPSTACHAADRSASYNRLA